MAGERTSRQPASTEPDLGAPIAASPSARASDADRNEVVARLSQATGEGLITLEEFADAAGAAYAAVTVADLNHLYQSYGLTEEPRTRMPSSRVSSPVSTTRVSPAVPEKIVAVMSGNKRKGRWLVRRRTRAVAFWGSVHLDLRDAVIESDVVDIEARAVMGGITVIVPAGIAVEMTGTVVMGGGSCRTTGATPATEGPLVRVRASGLWGSVTVRSGRSMGSERSRSDGHASNGRASHGSPSKARTGGRRAGGPPPQSGDLLTVVCTDIVESTRLSIALGDQRWHVELSNHNSLVRGLLARFGGQEVKTSGDGFLLTFTSARAALRFSMALQEAVADRARSTPERAMALRVGVHAGEVERDASDIIGRNVVIACRLCEAAAPGEVLASAIVADLADSASDLTFGAVRDHDLAGLDRAVPARAARRAGSGTTER